jgi:colanic acid/amylovoran biosynthesis glycosyltransferase
MDEAREFVESETLGDAVSLRGRLHHHDVLDLLSSADVFVQHSVTDVVTGDEEGLPVAILEAMAASPPVIATQHPGIREAVVDGTTAFLVDEGDWPAMAHRLVQVADDRALRARMGHAGWRRARACFTWDRERVTLLELLGLGESA